MKGKPLPIRSNRVIPISLEAKFKNMDQTYTWALLSSSTQKIYSLMILTTRSATPMTLFAQPKGNLAKGWAPWWNQLLHSYSPEWVIGISLIPYSKQEEREVKAVIELPYICIASFTTYFLKSNVNEFFLSGK